MYRASIATLTGAIAALAYMTAVPPEWAGHALVALAGVVVGGGYIGFLVTGKSS